MAQDKVLGKNDAKSNNVMITSVSKASKHNINKINQFFVYLLCSLTE